MSGTIVVDTSALVAAVSDQGSMGRSAREQLNQQRRHAPFLIDAEVGNALRRMVLRQGMDEAAARHARRLAEQLVHSRHPHVGVLGERAWQLRSNVTFHDALYVALAESLDCPLLTADLRLVRALPDHDLVQPP